VTEAFVALNPPSQAAGEMVLGQNVIGQNGMDKMVWTKLAYSFNPSFDKIHLKVLFSK